jgi:hypothetical protein
MLNSDVTYLEFIFNKQLGFRKRFDLFKCRKPNFVFAPFTCPRNQIELFVHCNASARHLEVG